MRKNKSLRDRIRLYSPNDTTSLFISWRILFRGFDVRPEKIITNHHILRNIFRNYMLEQKLKFQEFVTPHIVFSSASRVNTA